LPPGAEDAIFPESGMVLWLKGVATLAGVVSRRMLFKQWGWSTEAKSKVENNKKLAEA
jgi:hypothetical protein